MYTMDWPAGFGAVPANLWYRAPLPGGGALRLQLFAAAAAGRCERGLPMLEGSVGSPSIPHASRKPMPEAISA
jgi:hypothetical protein